MVNFDVCNALKVNFYVKKIGNCLFVFTICYQNGCDTQKVTAAGAQPPTMKSQI